ncbi:DNA-3-methyladenine glycosylase [Filimonas lacunae]|uniref:Putative 3-methyladenine DNA glycosylase n=1 Tax=Filimonas lacunae TaxID=477680 RepID=A0A173MS16_9BACT|nr:DNA-3-methyladenine glycosylase [Filimonas lacunae]BAV10287.1 DNA-3-methyladenine glycosylase II [Filimonas lacunae]SIT17459.1 DNA-3-methyladenine glycosylase [Filimonas lacunae]
MPRKSNHINQSEEVFGYGQKLDQSFYLRKNVVTIARELLGKMLITVFDGVITAGRIVETEAYEGVIDKASHAYGGRRTNRTEVMYAAGGTAYVFLCYGMHQMFNVVTNVKDTPHAILIRAVEPVTGIETMLQRTGKPKADFTLTRGPGNVAKALGISVKHTGENLLGNVIWIADDGTVYSDEQVVATARIGVDYAGEHALWPYRFIVKGNKYVSGKKK